MAIGPLIDVQCFSLFLFPSTTSFMCRNWWTVAFNLVRNYSPHLAPNTKSAPSTAELRKVLGLAAREMLVVFLRKSRARRSVSKGKGVGSTGDPLDIVCNHYFHKSLGVINYFSRLLTLSLWSCMRSLRGRRTYMVFSMNPTMCLWKRLNLSWSRRANTMHTAFYSNSEATI